MEWSPSWEAYNHTYRQEIHGTRRFLNVIPPLDPVWAKCMQFTSAHHISLRAILILFANASLQVVSSFQIFGLKMFTIYFSHMDTTRPVHLPPLIGRDGRDMQHVQIRSRFRRINCLLLFNCLSIELFYCDLFLYFGNCNSVEVTVG